MNDIVSELEKKKCESITKKKEWIRKCPKCGKIIYYTQSGTYYRCLRKNVLCKRCAANSRKNVHPMLGKHHSDKTKQKLSEFHKNKHKGKRNSFYGKKHTKESRIKMRVSLIERIKKKFGLMSLRFNENACKYFDELNQENGWCLKHGLNGGEFYIKDLGYYVDGYDQKRNIIIEYDEPYHNSPTQKEKDIQRTNEIKNHLKCRFFRYNESKNLLYEV